MLSRLFILIVYKIVPASLSTLWSLLPEAIVAFFSFIVGTTVSSTVIPVLIPSSPGVQGAVGLPIELQTLLSMGVGGAVSAIVLVWKRQDDKTYQRSLESIIARQDAVMQQFIKIIENSTSTMQALQVTVGNLSNIRVIMERLDDMDRNDAKRTK